jgi:hypothetical protein
VFSVQCLMSGHEDVFARGPHRLWLQCLECGRQTSGWAIDGKLPPGTGRSTGGLRPTVVS